MSIKSSLIKNTGFNLASYAYLLVASFFSISVLLGNLGRDLFGVYLFLGAFIPLSAVFDFGISTAVVRRLSLPEIEKKERISTWKTSFSLFIFIGAIISLVVLGLLIYLTRTLPMFQIINSSTINWVIAILTVTIFINHINSHFLSLPQAEQRFDIFNSKTLLVGSANTVLSAFLSSIYPDIALIFLLQLIFHFFTLLFMASYSSKIFKGKDFLPGYERSEGEELINFGLKNFIGTLANQIEAQFSKYALGIMVSAQAITAFSIPQNIVAKGAGIVSQVAQAFFPLGTSLLQKDRVNKLKNLVIIIELLALAGGILAIILSFSIGKEFLLWWLKDEVVVNMAYPILKIMSVYFLLNALTPIPTVILQSMGKPQVASFFAVFTAILNAVGMFVLIPRFGAMGAAYSTLLSAAITVPTVLVVTWVLFDKQIKSILLAIEPQPEP